MKFILITCSILVFIGLGILSYYGMFATIKVEQKKTGPYVFVYEKHIGPYKNTNKVMDRIYNLLLENEKIPTTRGFGIYYDKPGSVPESELRSIVGCILDSADLHRVEELSTRYQVSSFPSSSSLVVEFPYRGVLSVFLGIFRVYPKLAEFLEQGNYPSVPIMEIYDVPGKKIIYNVPYQVPSDHFNQYLK